MKKFIYLILFFITAQLNAQFDPQFTQYMYNESFINPAYAGAHDALSMTLLGRRQWVGFPGAPANVTFSGHTPIAKDRIGIGLNFMNESIGVMYRNLALVNVAYRLPLGPGKFCFGLQGGMAGYTERLSNVSTIQSNDNQFTASTPLLFGPNVGAGTYYYTKSWYVGLSVPRMMINTSLGNAVSTKFAGSSLTYYLTGGYVFDINEDLKLKPTLMIKASGGAPISAEISAQAVIKNTLWAGLSYRYNDAVAILLGCQVNQQFRIGYSYDYTISQLAKYNSGSHEMVLNYIFKYKNANYSNPRYF